MKNSRATKNKNLKPAATSAYSTPTERT